MTSNDTNQDLSGMLRPLPGVMDTIAGQLREDKHSDVTEAHHVVTFGPVGSENRMAWAYRRVVDGRVEARIVAGCWGGTIGEFRTRISDTYGPRGDTPNATHHGMYWSFANTVEFREQQWQAEYEPPKPKARIENAFGSWHGYLDSARNCHNPKGYVAWFRDTHDSDAKAEAEAWLARQLADDEPTDDEPKRCSYVDELDRRCRMNEGHPTDVWLHYCRPDSAATCDHDGCVRVPHHTTHHTLADGTEVPA